nr:DNA polymerase III subunit chi [Halomonas socia]
MTQVDFYVLPDTTLEARLAFACRLTETIQRKGYRLHLHAEDEAMARQLDEVLWTFRPDAYVPHALAGSEMASQVPVVIGWQGPPTPPRSTPRRCSTCIPRSPNGSRASNGSPRSSTSTRRC